MFMIDSISKAKIDNDQTRALRAHLASVHAEAAALNAQVRLCLAEIRFVETRLRKAIAEAEKRRWSPTGHAFAAAAAGGHAAALAAMLTPPPTAETSQQAAIAPEPAIQTPVREDFTLIRGIDVTAAAVLYGFGLTHFQDLAAFQAEDVEIVSRALGDERRLNRQCWIEQAAMLSHGKLTAFARERLAENLPPDNVVEFPAAVAQPSAAEPMNAAPQTSEIEAEHGAVAELTAVRASGTALVLVHSSHKASRRKSRGTWPLVAASIATLAIASLATFGIRPAVAQYFEVINCTQSSLFPTSCAQVTWVQN